jgi:hypothetical protein
MSDSVYGHVIDDVCVNVVVASAEWVAQQPDTWILSTAENLAWKGAVVTDGIFEPLPSAPLMGE